MKTYPPLVSERPHLASVFERTVAEYGKRPAHRIRAEESPTGFGRRDGIWLVLTWDEVAARVNQMARALIDAGVEHGDRVAMFTNNCPEWLQFDIACQQIGAIVVPLYATSTVEQIRHIVNDSGSEVIVTGGDSENDRVVEAREGSALRMIISLVLSAHDDVINVADFIANPSDESVDELARRRENWSPDDLFSIIYTSGTTGEPRGVMLTHGAMIAQNAALDVFFHFGPEENSLAFLPLSHALERAWSVYCMGKGTMNTFCPDARQAAEMLVLCQPTLLVSVPRLFEKVVATAKEKVSGSAAKQKIFTWALRVGGQMQHAYRKGKTPRLYWRAQFPLADKLVLKAVRDAMGGPKKVVACGGAPLRVDVEEFFSAIGIPILPGYGLTEAAPLVTFNSPEAFKVGTCGRVMAGGELRVWNEGEILYRGLNVMKGYWNNPEATEATFLPADPNDDNQEHWLKTGDAGYVDVDGFLVITDRLKDIIVTSGGKNVAPQMIEGMLMTDPLFEQAVLLGDNRPYLTLLVKPSLPGLAEIAEKFSLGGRDLADQLRDPQVVEEVKRRARKMTDRLPSHEQFKDMRVLLEDFTLENGLLTPTLKVRRREVEKRFSQLIEDMYNRASDWRDDVREAMSDLKDRVFDDDKDDDHDVAKRAEAPAHDDATDEATPV